VYLEDTSHILVYLEKALSYVGEYVFGDVESDLVFVSLDQSLFKLFLVLQLHFQRLNQRRLFRIK
jgi:hypothetical protein